MKLLVLPATNIFDAVAQTAVELKASEIVVGESAVISPEDQAHQMGEAWDRTPHERELTTQFVIHSADGQVEAVLAGRAPADAGAGGRRADSRAVGGRGEGGRPQRAPPRHRGRPRSTASKPSCTPAGNASSTASAVRRGPVPRAAGLRGST